jgi:hypothetical protein
MRRECKHRHKHRHKQSVGVEMPNRGLARKTGVATVHGLRKHGLINKRATPRSDTRTLTSQHSQPSQPSKYGGSYVAALA